MQIAKKVLAVFLAMLFVLPGLGVGMTASARGDRPDGSCGDDVYYKFSGDALTIYGDGPTYNYGDYNQPNASPFADRKDIKEVTIQDGVTYVGNNLFDSCESLQSLSLPSSLEEIGRRAFTDCLSLQTVTIPNSVWVLRDSAFSDCYSLTNVIIPSSMARIELHAFYNSDTLTVNYTGSPADWGKIDVDSGAFTGTTLTINYYYGVEGAENAIGDIGTVEYTPECKARIDAARAAFDALSDADKALVTNANDLPAAEQKYAQLEAQATELAKGGDCSYRLSDVHYTFDKSTCTLTISGTGEIKPASFQKTDAIRHVVIEQGVTNVSKLLFYRCTGLQSVTIPSSVTKIDDEAFQDCSALTSVTLPDGLQSIGNKAFENCSALTSVTLPHSLERTDADVFRGCTALMSVTIPDSMTLLNRSVFQDCSSLTDVYYTGSEADWNGMTIAGSAFAGTPDTRKVYYYCGVEGAENAISDVGTVEYTPECKARIDAARAAFDKLSDEDKALVSNAGDLTAAEAEYARLEEQATKLAQAGSCGTGTYTFDKSTCTLTVSGNATIDLLEFSGLDVIRHVVIEQGVTFIGSSAFRRCTGLQSVTIPDSVTDIGMNAFGDCTALTSVTIPGSVTEIGDQAFKNCSALMSVTIPNGVQQILKSVFAGCTALQSVTIPDSVTHISSQAFYNCAALTSVTIPDSVTNIGSFAFSGCTALTSVTIPNSVKSIGSSAFFGCSSLTAVYFTGSEAQWRAVRKVSDSFRGTPDTLKVYYYYGVEGATNAINDVGDVEYTPECKARIDAARAAYDALSDEDKAKVTNANDLFAAEAEYARLEDEALHIPGDVNKDGALDSADALAIKRYAASLLSEEARAHIDIQAGDLNGNSDLDVSDGSMIQEYLVGERESLLGKKPALPAGNNHVTENPDVTFAFTAENGSSEVSVPAGKATTLQVPVIISSDQKIGAALDVQFKCSDGIRITGITETITENIRQFTVYTNDSTLRANAVSERTQITKNNCQIFILTVEIPDTAPEGATYTVGFDDLCQVSDLKNDAQKLLYTTAFTPLTIQITQASYPVTFKSWDGAAVLKEETVTAGGDATPPEIPARMSDATYHYIPGEWTGYTNITAPTTLNAPYTAEAHNFNGNACTVCDRLRNTMANQMEYNNYVACNADLLSYLESSPALFRMALADHGLAGSTYTDAGDALIDKAMEDLDPLLSEDEFYAAGKHFQWYADKYNGIRQTLDAGLNEIINLGVFGNAREEQKRVAGELAQSGDSAECLALIEAAQKAIDALEYDKTKSLDDNLARVQDIVTTLDSDLTALRKQETDTAAANAVEEKITAIGDVEYTDESKQKIDDAREAYDNLTGDQQALVSNADDLIAAENAYQLYDDKATFEEYKEALTQEAVDKRLPGDSDACRQLIEEAIAAINSATYDEAQSLQQNKDAVDEAANLTQLDKDLADQRAADAVEDLIDAIGEVELTDENKQKIDDAREAYNDLTDEQKALVPKDVVKTLTDAEAEYEKLDNHAQFEQYKEDMQKAAGEKAQTGDSDECKQLIDDAIDAINDVQYDENNTLQQNKDAVDEAANFAQLDADLAEHRAIHYADFYADGKPVESVPYTIDTKSIDEPAVPEKTGHTGAWPSYTLEAGGVRVDAVYETIPYEAEFYADGVLIDTVTYTVETTSIADEEPAVPEKPGHTGTWPEYTLKVGGTRIDAVYKVIMQTVDFDANGGKGEMESVTTAWGSKVTLPECTFTAPNGKAFDKWDAGDPGDEVEVKSDLTVKAVWKEKPLTLTADVDPTQTGERIKITVPYAKRGGIAATLTASEEGVRYESSKPGVISVDENGVIRLEKLCLFCKTATITAYSASGEKVASCVVNVRHAWWQYIIWFFFGSFWF